MLSVPFSSSGSMDYDKLSINKFGHEIISHHFLTMLSHEYGTFLGKDIDALHDMRVATRRLRVSIDVFASHLIPELPVEFQPNLKTMGKVLGRVRDYDVLIDQLKNEIQTGSVSTSKPMTNYMNYCLKLRKKNQKKLRKYFLSEEYSRFKESLAHYLETTNIGSNESTGEASLIKFSHNMIFNSVQRLKTNSKMFLGASLDELHSLRINVKSFRYRLEFFEKIHKKELTPCIRAIKKIQDHLGQIQDIRFAIKTINRYLSLLGSPGSAEHSTPHPSPQHVNIEKLLSKKEQYLSVLC